jgi:flagellar biosynthesis protein FlhF
MDVKKYHAASMPEALAQVRAELGADATVLSARHVTSSDWTGRLRGDAAVEVVATSELKVESRLPLRQQRAPRRIMDAGIDLTQLDSSPRQSFPR